MKRTAISLLTIVSLTCSVLVLTAARATAMPDGVARQSFWISPTSAVRDITTPSSPQDYRTSPSIFLDASTSQYQQFNCGPDPSTGTQVIRYATSADGQAWSPQTVVLRPTANSFDSSGVCDPSVVKAGPYYYLAYTGEASGTHKVFVARTSSLSQPWQKWTGFGWGGSASPAPILSSSVAGGWGFGQPSLVVRPEGLAIYFESHQQGTWQTRLALAPLRADNVNTWPAQIGTATVVLAHPGTELTGMCGGFYDSTDVAYHDAQQKFVAITTDSKTFADSSLRAYESPSGSGFTEALTSSWLGTNNPLWERAHNVAFVRDAAGHVSGTSAVITYSHGPTDCPSSLAWQPATIDSKATGWVNEPLSPESGVAHWRTDSGQWQFDQGKWKVRTGFDQARAQLLTNVASANATIDLDYDQAGWPFGQWTGLSFGQPTVGGGEGYFLRMYTTGTVTLAKGNEDNVVATGTTSGSAQVFTNHLQVVLSENRVTVYNGVGNGALTNVILQYTSPENLVLAGYIGLQSSGTSWFSNLTVRDNVPATYRSQDDTVLDWKESTGDWKVRAPSSLFAYVQSGNQIFLQGRAVPVGDYNAHFGNGTYTATVRLNPGSPATSWGGINVTNSAAQTTLDWATGGYLVFIRANGNLGLYRGGSPGHQVVADIPTGLNPVSAPVRIRVVKVGPSLQVYLNGAANPTIKYSDFTSFGTSVGGFGLATEQAAGEFTNVAYSATGG